jgi:hypothetical protein
VYFQGIVRSRLRPSQRRDTSRFGRNKRLFKINRTRNKSGALLLTLFDLTIRRGDEPFRKRRRGKRHPPLRQPGSAAHERTFRSTDAGGAAPRPQTPLIRPLVLSLHLFPNMSGLAHGKPLLGIDSGNNVTSSRVPNSKRVPPVSCKTFCLDILPYQSPLAPIARGFCF